MRFPIIVTLAVALSVGCVRNSSVREDAPVQVGRASEQWRLEWRTAPTAVCPPVQGDVPSCPCAGFAYGETGQVDLVRRLTSGIVDRLSLAPLFLGQETPAADGVPVLQQWPVRDADYTDTSGTERAFRQRVEARPFVRLMNFGDYNHDGQATEFVLQVGALPCGKREAVLVGVSRDHPSLHAFASTAHPERPLVLEATIWAALLKSSDVTAVEWACGDHGGEEQTEVRLAATPTGFDGSRFTYTCTADGHRGKLLSSAPL